MTGARVLEYPKTSERYFRQFNAPERVGFEIFIEDLAEERATLLLRRNIMAQLYWTGDKLLSREKLYMAKENAFSL